MSDMPSPSAVPVTSPPKPKLSITHKLVALIVLTTGAIVLFLASYFPTQQIRAAHAALERKAATYGQLVGKQVAPAIAFDDQETAREVFDSLAQDADVESQLLLTAAGSTLYARGVPGAWVSAAKRGVSSQRVLDLGDRIAVVTPVVSAEGPRGTLVIELSTLGLAEARAEVLRTAAIAGGIALLFGALLAYAIARSLGRRLAQIGAVANAVAAGNLEHEPAAVSGGDEIAQLAYGFNVMLQQLKSLVAQIRKHAQDEQVRLEELVAQRTEALDVRNRDMRMVLDNVGQGFFSADLDGQLSPERSAIVTQWLGPACEGEPLFAAIERAFPDHGDHFRVAWDALRDDWMPLEMRIDQLPSQLVSNGKSFGFSYKPVCDGEVLKKILIVMSDTTALMEKRLVEEEEQELAQIVRKLLSDGKGFRDFVAEADELVGAIEADHFASWQRLRYLHTLKGNAAIFGFVSLSRLCHELEGEMTERGEDLSPSAKQRLRTSWQRLQHKVASLTEHRSSCIEVAPRDYARLVERIDSRAPHSELSGIVAAFTLEPAEGRLARLGEYARSLAMRLGKAPIDIRIEANEVRLDPELWTPMWQALVHVVRNAIDHGLETQDERKAEGKSEASALVFRTRNTGNKFVLEVEDNGRGIDWQSVARIAKKRGMAANTPEDLRAALFADGLSTREHATETSGRGVGLSAVNKVCSDTGGQLSIETQLGRGTKFRFEWTLTDGFRPGQTAAANDHAMTGGESLLHAG